MDKKLFSLAVLPAATILAAVVASPVQASYVCTGQSVGGAAGNPFFNGDLLDTGNNCGITELADALGVISIDTSTALGSKTNSVGNISGWSQDEPGLGTLTVDTWTQTTGTWSLTDGGITPLFFVEKYDSGYDLYTYMGPDSDPFSDSWDGVNNRGTNGEPCRTTGGGPPVGVVNCNATTSHISVYYAETVVPIPAAVWLFGSGLLGLVGIARRRRS